MTDQSKPVEGAPRAVAVAVGFAVAGFGGYAIGWIERIPWWGGAIICMVGLAISLPNRMAAIWSATRDKVPSLGGGGS